MCDEAEEETPAEISAYAFRWTMPLAWFAMLLAGLAHVLATVTDNIETDVLALHNNAVMQRDFENEVRADLERIPTTQE